jgi:hypothetical protein
MEVGPGTLGTWVNTIGGEKVVPLINLMHETLLAVVFIHIDETPLQVLRSDKAVGADHYIVARAGGPPGPPALPQPKCYRTAELRHVRCYRRSHLSPCHLHHFGGSDGDQDDFYGAC